MSTKHDSICLQKAADDEPIFVLRAQDVLAPELVYEWATRAERLGTNQEKVNEARRVAEQMSVWPHRKVPT